MDTPLPNSETLIGYTSMHWLAWLAGGIGLGLVWVAAQFFGAPLKAFLRARQDALSAVERHGFIGHSATEARVREARDCLWPLVSRLSFYWRSGPWSVRVYCLLRGYNLEYAYRALNGILVMAGSPYDRETRENNIDLLRWMLGADLRMTDQRKRELRKLLEEKATHQEQ